MNSLSAIVLLVTIFLAIGISFNMRTARTCDVTAPGKALRARFIALGGGLMGKTVGEIVAGVGLPTSRSPMGNGQMLLHWQATGYDIALLQCGRARYENHT